MKPISVTRAGSPFHSPLATFFITDPGNHRIQVFDNYRVYVTTINTTNESGSNNTHFDYPVDVAVNANGDVFVADSNNFRIQKCVTADGLQYECSPFARVTGDGGDGWDFERFHPSAVAVDSTGRVYVGDELHQRVLIYDSDGAFLTSIGGSWGTNTGQFQHISSIGLDSQRNLYVSDSSAMTVQKFSPGIPGWKQINVDGFGLPGIDIATLAVFNGQLYAGTVDNYGNGALIYQEDSGSGWVPVIDPGFGDGGAVNVIVNLFVYQDYLYASTGVDSQDSARIYRTHDGTSCNPWSLTVLTKPEFIYHHLDG